MGAGETAFGLRHAYGERHGLGKQASRCGVPATVRGADRNHGDVCDQPGSANDAYGRLRSEDNRFYIKFR